MQATFQHSSESGPPTFCRASQLLKNRNHKQKNCISFYISDPYIYIHISRRCMNLLFAFLMLTAPLSSPQVYYYNGKNLVDLKVIRMPNAPRARVRLFVHSPVELRDACIDSSNADMCLPGIPLRRKLKLEGRWYIVRWEAHLSVGSSRHVVKLFNSHHKAYTRTFRIDVEGSKRVRKPQGVN